MLGCSVLWTFTCVETRANQASSPSFGSPRTEIMNWCPPRLFWLAGYRHVGADRSTRSHQRGLRGRARDHYQLRHGPHRHRHWHGKGGLASLTTHHLHFVIRVLHERVKPAYQPLLRYVPITYRRRILGSAIWGGWVAFPLLRYLADQEAFVSTEPKAGVSVSSKL